MKAFPIDYNVASIDKWQGMDLRDYFAAKAMQALLSRDGSAAGIGRGAYVVADLMMEARKNDK